MLREQSKVMAKVASRTRRPLAMAALWKAPKTGPVLQNLARELLSCRRGLLILRTVGLAISLTTNGAPASSHNHIR